MTKSGTVKCLRRAFIMLSVMILAAFMLCAQSFASEDTSDSTENLNLGTISVNLHGGMDFVFQEKLPALSNVLEWLVDEGSIKLDNDLYDLDKDGTPDVRFEHEDEVPMEQGYNPEMLWFYMDESTNLDGMTWSIDVPKNIQDSLRWTGKPYCEKVEFVFPTLIRKISITLPQPLHGTKVSVSKDKNGEWEYEKQTNSPGFKVLNGNKWLYYSAAYWTVDTKSYEPFTGVMTGGESYNALVYLIPEEEYKIADDVSVRVNGIPVKVDYSVPVGIAIDVDMEASYTPAKAAFSKLKSGKGKVTASWKNNGSMYGWQLRFVNTKTGKTKSVNAEQTEKTFDKKTISRSVKLNKGKYKVQIRAMNAFRGTKLYGAWSKGKSITVK